MNLNRINQEDILKFSGDSPVLIDSFWTSLSLNAYTEGVTESKRHDMRIKKIKKFGI